MNKVLVSKTFGYNFLIYSNDELTKFVNENHISRDDIQAIVYSETEGLLLFYWKEAEYTHISDNLKYSMKQEEIVDAMDGRR